MFIDLCLLLFLCSTFKAAWKTKTSPPLIPGGIAQESRSVLRIQVKKTFLHMCIICWLFKFVKQKGEMNTDLRNLWLYWWILINNVSLINILNITLNNEHRLNKVRAIMNQFYTMNFIMKFALNIWWWRFKSLYH